MNAPRTAAFVAGATLLLLACTLTRDLDYLTEGDAGPGGETSTSSGNTTSSSSSSSTGGEAGPIAGTPLVQKQLNPTNLIQDADNLYWTNDDNQVMRVAKSGGEPKELSKLASADVGAIEAMTIDPSAGGNLYILIDGAVKTVPRDGGPIADFIASTTIASIAADDTFLFVVNVDATTDEATLVRYPKASGTQPTTIGPPAGAQFTEPGAIALFGDSVYWTINDQDFIQVLHQVPKTAASPVAPIVWRNTGKNAEKETAGVAAVLNEELAIDNDGIYWVDDNDYIPYRLLRTQPEADAPSLLNASAVATSITVDESFIYVLTASSIVKMGKVDRNPTSFTVEPDATALISDGKNLYYVYPGDGTTPTGGLSKLPK